MVLLSRTNSFCPHGFVSDGRDPKCTYIESLIFTDPEIMETFDRANYRQSGSSLDSNNEFKKKKNAKIFKFGMFKYV